MFSTVKFSLSSNVTCYLDHYRRILSTPKCADSTIKDQKLSQFENFIFYSKKIYPSRLTNSKGTENITLKIRALAGRI